MTEVWSTAERAYTYESGLIGDVIIEHANAVPEIRLPGAELKQLVKQATPRPMVGISPLVIDESGPDIVVLLGKRKGSHGEGLYGTPGGHQENGESYEDAALRELAEECGPGFRVGRPRFLCVTNLTNYLPKHYTDIGMITRYQSGAPWTMEPDKCEGWEWHPIDELPTPRFGAVDNLIVAYQTGQVYFPSADA